MLKTNLVNTKSEIKTINNNTYYVRIVANGELVIFHGEPIKWEQRFANYTEPITESCVNHYPEVLYAPVPLKNFIDLVDSNKIYGVMDEMPCNKGFTLTLQTRCNHNYVEISLPVLFFKQCNEVDCGYIATPNLGLKNFNRKVIEVSSSSLNPITHRKKVSCNVGDVF